MIPVKTGQEHVASLRDGPEALAFCNRADLPEAAWRGVVTPDHTIRIKNRPLVLSAPEAGRLDDPRTESALSSLESMQERDGRWRPTGRWWAPPGRSGSNWE